jgi:hypothetical protein
MSQVGRQVVTVQVCLTPTRAHLRQADPQIFLQVVAGHLDAAQLGGLGRQLVPAAGSRGGGGCFMCMHAEKVQHVLFTVVLVPPQSPQAPLPPPPASSHERALPPLRLPQPRLDAVQHLALAAQRVLRGLLDLGGEGGRGAVTMQEAAGSKWRSRQSGMKRTCTGGGSFAAPSSCSSGARLAVSRPSSSAFFEASSWRLSRSVDAASETELARSRSCAAGG